MPTHTKVFAPLAVCVTPEPIHTVLGPVTVMDGELEMGIVMGIMSEHPLPNTSMEYVEESVGITLTVDSFVPDGNQT
jgi:hypothetical protein